MRFALLTCCLLFAARSSAQTHVLIITGLGGEPRYAQAFAEWADMLRNAAINRFGLLADDVVYLAGREGANTSGRSTKENVEAALLDLAETTRPTDQIFIFLIGHGSETDGEARLNLPGPDMGSGAFGALLDMFSTQRVVLVNMASASGQFVAALSGPYRTIVTATRSGTERHETVFGGFFSRAFSEDVADIDKDERVSILEAFNYARLEVRRFYESENRLLTEHALLDDNGDGEGSLEPDAQAGDGALARTMFMTAAVAAVFPDDPELAALYQKRNALEDDIARLRTRKDDMDPAAYERELERLLLELARTSQAIRAQEGTQ